MHFLPHHNTQRVSQPVWRSSVERFRTPQQWHQALALAETPRYAPVWAQRFRCSWGLLRTRDSRTERCRLKSVVPNPQTTEKRKDYFDTAGATGSNRTPFAVPRLQLCSFVAKEVATLPWVEFKAFLRKSQGDSRVFVYITWSRIRQDS